MKGYQNNHQRQLAFFYGGMFWDEIVLHAWRIPKLKIKITQIGASCI
jgi:hypothetical protein